MLKLYTKINGKYQRIEALIPAIGVVKRVSITTAIDRYIKNCTSQKCDKNQKVEKNFFGKFETFMRQKHLLVISDVTYNDLVEFQNLLSLSLKASSVNRRFFTIKHFFVMCERWEFVLKNNCRDIKNKRAEKNPYKTWTEPEFKLLIGECDGVFRSLILFLWHTGCRPMEAKNLRWSDIDFDKLEITLKCGKNAKVSRIFPITTKVSKILHTMDMKGNVVFGGIKNDSLYQYCKHRLIRLKLERLTVYGMRHSFASRLSKAGVNVFLIQKLMGHADIKTTSGYVNSEKNELIDALKRANF